MLCSRCQDFDIQTFQRGSKPYRGIQLLAIIQSSNSCSFCSLLLWHLEKVHSRSYEVDRALFASKKIRDLKWFSWEPLKWTFSWSITRWTLLEKTRWVNLAVTRVPKDSLEGSHGLNIASLNFSMGSIHDAPKDPDFRFLVGADLGKYWSADGAQYTSY
jgi:hypothetical protein